MLQRAFNRAQADGGFTLIELLLVVVLLAVLIAIAVPAYLSFSVRADQQAAKQNIQNSVGPLVLWAGEHPDGYASVSAAKLKQSYNVDISLFWPTTTGYCVKSRVGTEVWYKGGPTADMTTVKPGPGVICP
jgi:type IV pilus assembly protein PilA